MTKKRRRSRGSGSITLRKDTGKYQAAIVIGYNEAGRPVSSRRSFATKSEAEVWLAEQVTLMHKGRTLQQASDQPTLQDAYDVWLEAGKVLKGWTPNTAKSYAWIIEKHILPYIGKRRLRDITPAVVRSLLQTIAAKGASPSMVRRVRLHLGLILNDAVKTDLLDTNPVDRVAAPRVSTPEIQRWTEAEVGKVVRYCLDMDSPIKRYVLVALGTGMRTEELLGLCWDAVDLEDSSLHVTRVATLDEHGRKILRMGGKTAHAERLIPFDHMTKRALLVQQGYADGIELVFPNTVGNIWDRGRLRAAFNKLCEAAGVPRIKLYATRSTHGSLLADAGVNLHALAERLGHSDPRFTAKVYLSGSQSAHRAVADQFGALLDHVADEAESEVNLAPDFEA